MKLQTKYFGVIEYDADDVITFPGGLFGFDEERTFLLIPFEGSQGNMLCLQSTATSGLAFVVMNPFSLDPGYTPTPSPDELAALSVSEGGELGYYVLCAVKNPVSNSTVNLRCPVAINVDTRVARQLILDNARYEMRHPLSQFGDAKGGDLC